MAGFPTPRSGAADHHARLIELSGMLGHVGTDLVARAYAALTDRADHGERRRARDDLSLALAGLRRDADERLSELFRNYVGATVCAVSPLVVAACRIEGLDLDATVGLLRYEDGRRQWLGGPAPLPASILRRLPDPGTDLLRPHEVVRRFQRCGVVIREDGEGAGALGFRVGATCLEIGMRTAAMGLSTREGRAVLTLRYPLPETIRIAVRGRRLDEVVDFPLVNGRGYVITGAFQRPGIGTALAFRAEPLPWRMPWARRWVRDDAEGNAGRGGG